MTEVMGDETLIGLLHVTKKTKKTNITHQVNRDNPFRPCALDAPTVSPS